MAIITDLFALQQRGRVMGFVTMGFGASQVLGIPIGLYIANLWGWEAPFLMVAGMAVMVAVFIAITLKPVTQHLKLQHDKSAFTHLWHTVSKRDYRIGFMATAVLSIGGFMMMPFGSVFAVNNLHVTEKQLPLLFMVSGVSALAVMPLVGRLSDKVSKYKLFAVACLWMIAVCVIYTNLSITPFWIVLVLNVMMMMGVMGRMVPSQALMSAVPEMEDRGAFMSINASLQQIAGGIGAAVAGMIVYQDNKFSPLKNYDIVGYVVFVISLISIYLMYRVNEVAKKRANERPLLPKEEAEEILIATEF